MRLFRDYLAQPQPSQVVVLGAFDGLHRGHQALIQQAQALVTSAGDRATVGVSLVCFEPLPRQYFSGAQPVPRLSSVGERLRRLRQLGIHQTWQLRFNTGLATTSAEAFVEHVIIDRLRARHVVVGEDFRFGAGRHGDVAVLRRIGQRAGFTVHPVAALHHANAVISSSRIRQALAAGDLALAAALLGRPFSMIGRVCPGQQLGRDLGYPTANLALPRRHPPLTGIFAVRVRLADTEDRLSAEGELLAGGELLARGELLDGVASLGYRPTVNPGAPLLEVHLLDYSGNLYQRRLEVFFLQKLRDEAHFPTIAAMVEQIHDDVAQARRFLQQG